MRAYKFFNRIENSILLPFIICSAISVAVELISIVTVYSDISINILLSNIADVLTSLIPYIIVYFVTIHFVQRDRNIFSFWSVICVALFSAVYQEPMTILFALLYSFLACCIYNNFNKVISLSSVMIITIMIALIISLTDDFVKNYVMTIAEFVSKKSSLSSGIFGFINTAFKMFSSDYFEELFSYRSYGGTIIVNENLVTGIKDMAENGYNGKILSVYLSGHYYQLFSLLGVGLSLSDDIKGSHRVSLIIVVICAIISGDIRLALLFILLESPWLAVAFVFISALSYFTADILDLSCAYILSGGAIELFFNSSRTVYLFVGGLVFVAIGYFVTKYITLKFGITDSLNTYIPTKLNGFVEALGGVMNIVKIDDNVVEVRNPKLIDTFKVKCEIKENLVKTDDGRLKELEDYL